MKTVHTLKYDAKLAEGKRFNYGRGGYCTEVERTLGKRELSLLSRVSRVCSVTVDG